MSLNYHEKFPREYWWRLYTVLLHWYTVFVCVCVFFVGSVHVSVNYEPFQGEKSSVTTNERRNDDDDDDSILFRNVICFSFQHGSFDTHQYHHPIVVAAVVTVIIIVVIVMRSDRQEVLFHDIPYRADHYH